MMAKYTGNPHMVSGRNKCFLPQTVPLNKLSNYLRRGYCPEMQHSTSFVVGGRCAQGVGPWKWRVSSLGFKKCLVHMMSKGLIKPIFVGTYHWGALRFPSLSFRSAGPPSWRPVNVASIHAFVNAQTWLCGYVSLHPFWFIVYIYIHRFICT